MHQLTIDVGIDPITLNVPSLQFVDALRQRYGAFAIDGDSGVVSINVDLVPQSTLSESGGVKIGQSGQSWEIDRGDFTASLDSDLRHGTIRQAPSVYPTDCLLRAVHILRLARRGGFMLHSSSAVRNGRSFLFTGVSGAGKTTLVRQAPEDVAVLTDEISYVDRVVEDGNPFGYRAWGTPYFGDLSRPGTRVSAPVANLYFLEKRLENRVDPIEHADATRRFLRNVLFYGRDPYWSRLVFGAACDFMAAVPAHRLGFLPQPSAWDLIQ